MKKYRIHYLSKFLENKTIIFEGSYFEAEKFAKTLGKVEKIEDITPNETSSETNKQEYQGYFSVFEND